MFSVRTRIIISVLIILGSALFFSPNLAEREVDIFFNEKIRLDPLVNLGDPDAAQEGNAQLEKAEDKGSFQSQYKTVNDAQVQKWVEMVRQKYSREGDIVVEREDVKGWPKNRHYVLRGRFISAAYLNKIIQANPDLTEIIDKRRTRIRPHWMEESLGFGSIRLGLDLQGGLAIQIRGDFEGYLEEKRKLYPEKRLEEWRQKIEDPKTKKKEREDLEAKLASAEDELELTEEEVRRHLEFTRMLLESRLMSGLKIQEAAIKVVPNARALEVNIPGVSNPEEVKDFLTQTDTVSYHIVLKDTEKFFPRSVWTEKFKEYLEIDPADRPHFLDQVEAEYNFVENNAMLRVFYDQRRQTRKSKKKKEQASGVQINTSGSTLEPRYFMVLEREASLDGGDVKRADALYDQENLGWIVSFDLNDKGSEKFQELTTNNIGKQMAIVIGDKVRSAPSINVPITGGRAQITGSFRQKEAVNIAQIMKEGSLPIPLKIVQERNIGATLGEETIERGVTAVVVGFVAVIVFMTLWYLGAGLVATLALMLNMVILAGLLSLGKVTLTLPGFAGIILTLGMAVDTNVIIFERIKEELATGKSFRQSVDLGFARTLWTVLDANITTLLAGIVLIQLGEGPIKGFAITLCMGIISSLLSGLFMSRVMFDTLQSWNIRKMPVSWRKLRKWNAGEAN